MSYSGPERRKVPRVPVFTCPRCHGTAFKVADTRGFPDKDGVQRRRECLTCGRRILTEEFVIGTSQAPTSCV